MPAFSTDGENVLFVSNRSGNSQLYQKPVSGAGQDKLVATALRPQHPDLSSDGRFALYQVLESSWDLWAVPLAGDGKPFPIARTEHGERVGQFSPDVRWVAYDSTESGQREVWVQPFPPTGSKWQVSTTGGTSPKWRGDGKELFYVAADGMLTAVPIEPRRTFQPGRPKPLFQTMFRGGVYASYAPSHDGKRFLINVAPALEDITPITLVLNWTALLQR
jgi:eukaryotic-like serine/threonine-protein kinase